MLNWYLFKKFLLNKDDVILIAGDTITVTKSGKETYGLGHYFHSIYNRAVPCLRILNLFLMSVKQRQTYRIYLINI